MIIGIDLDSVIVDLMPPLIDFHNRHFGSSSVLKDYTKYDFCDIWKCSRKEVVERIFQFYRSPDFDKVKTIPGAVEGINHLSKKHVLHVITSRPNWIKEKTDRWILKHFPNKFTSIYHTNQFSQKGSPSQLKSEICRFLQAEIVIEDHLEFARDCTTLVKRVFLLDMPWNSQKKLPKKITRVFSWEEIVREIKSS